MPPIVAALVAAVLFWAAFPPLGWGLLAFVAPAPLLWAVRRVERGLDAFLLGFVFAGVGFGMMLWWIRILGFVAWIPLSVAMATFGGIFAVATWAVRLWPPARWWLITVGAWVLVEWIRTNFPFGGFPWGRIGYAAAGNPGFIGSVQWIGPGGWSVLVVALAAGLVLVIEDTANWRHLVDPLVVVLMLALAGSIFPPRADGTVWRAAIIQGNSPCPGTHCQNENRRIYASHLALTQTLAPGEFDLVVWPENSLGAPYEPEGNPDVRATLETEARRLGAYLLVSSTRPVGEDRFRNVNILFSPEGRKIGEYDKRHPVPFGEYVPLRGLLDFIPQLEQVPRDMIRGRDPVVFRLPEGDLGSVISFEGAFSELVRDEARIGADLMVVATNEGSFGEGSAADQLIGLTRVNAAAIGEDLIHAAITGKSAFISADGSVGPTTELFEATVLEGEVAFRSAGPTIFTRFGDWPVSVVLVAAFLALVVPGEARREALRGSRLEASPH